MQKRHKRGVVSCPSPVRDPSPPQGEQYVRFPNWTLDDTHWHDSTTTPLTRCNRTSITLLINCKTKRSMNNKMRELTRGLKNYLHHIDYRGLNRAMEQENISSSQTTHSSRGWGKYQRIVGIIWSKFGNDPDNSRLVGVASMDSWRNLIRACTSRRRLAS